ncbi:MAG: aminomethyl-transferring glycine dehydrogenase subunit GcvPB [Christensenella sp.]|uniref:aminomethyl-transferring glycine dehydrogenase subunit GcvPB n=1 Tax=Christensenella sp. TaxID=1935934 RepID=UPI002B1F723B|nr:aminomethyl-transferring glycine dehydrogenase subunit GcvPB [Christensenella sp.]MEA5003032.1 aminomethyl-transferring glycine dehydrogenase subunit GcvPB [Christensenella sp.]
MELIFEKSKAGRGACLLPKNELKNTYRPDTSLLRETPAHLPEAAEVDVVRHYIALSRRAHGVDNGFYPLGSCTMKYNPKINEKLASLPGFTEIHPLQPQETAQGCLEVLHCTQGMLNEIAGMDATTMQPAAGAHGEWTGLQLIRAYHLERGDEKRRKIIVPDSAHGTNPASAAMCGFDVVSVPSDKDGYVDPQALAALADDTVAGLMLTNPNTLGKFEKNICELSDIIHNAGGLLYYDGANMNAIMGVTRPGDMGFDVVHWNLHKTLSTPHGGGGPGSGAVGCKAFLEKYLPVPVVKRDGDVYVLDYDRPHSIGQVKMYYGNFLVIVKAFCYMLTLGGDGLKDASMHAVLNANYMLRALEKHSDLVYASPCMHEFVLSLKSLKKETGVSALDVAKAMIDAGIHPPTMYFPMIVEEALMFEPTETESVETLDSALYAIDAIFERAKTDPQSLHAAPVTTPVGRPDEVKAARDPHVRYDF